MRGQQPIAFGSRGDPVERVECAVRGLVLDSQFFADGEYAQREGRGGLRGVGVPGGLA